MNPIKMAMVLTLLTFTAPLANAQESGSKPMSQRKTGAGFILGEPSGFSFQFRANQPETINAGLAWSFDSWMQIWGDYVWHFPRFVSDLIQEHTAMDAYVGVGGGLIISNGGKFKNGSLGALVRVPLGLEYKINRPPLGFFLEIVPGFVFGASTAGKLQGGIGARFYF
jgi:hypothetical protein